MHRRRPTAAGRLAPRREGYPPAWASAWCCTPAPPLAGSHEKISRALRGAVIGAALDQGRAETARDGRRPPRRRVITLASAHEHGALGTYAGGIRPRRCLSCATRRSATSPTTDERGPWQGAALRLSRRRHPRAPALDGPRAGAAAGRRHPRGRGFTSCPSSPRPCTWATSATAATRRRARCSSISLRRTSRPALARQARRAEALTWLAANEIFFLNLTMAACKGILDAASGVPGASAVTCMAPTAPASASASVPSPTVVHRAGGDSRGRRLRGLLPRLRQPRPGHGRSRDAGLGRVRARRGPGPGPAWRGAGRRRAIHRAHVPARAGRASRPAPSPRWTTAASPPGSTSDRSSPPVSPPSPTLGPGAPRRRHRPDRRLLRRTPLACDRSCRRRPDAEGLP